MLQKIRKTTDSLIFRIFLGILVLSFAIWGVSDVVKGRGNTEIATFDKIDSITFDLFSKEKAEEIKNIQRKEGVQLSEEQIEKMNFNNMVLHKLIRNKLLEYLVKQYDLNFSDAIIAKVIRSLPLFKNSEGLFDIERFKSYLHMNGLTTDEYSKEIKDYLANTLILGSFVGNVYIPSNRVDSIIDHMSERRVIDISSISLTGSDRGDDITEDQLKNFYNENQDMFKTPWVRDICYVVIDMNSAKDNITTTDKEIRQYYDENKEEFGTKKFDFVKQEVRTKLQKQKFDVWIAEMSKSLEDEVAGGSSLQEITNKYKLKLSCENNITAQNIEARAGGVFAAFNSLILEMSEKEVSYPADFQGKGLVLFEVTKFTPEANREFAQVQGEVRAKYKSFSYRLKIVKKLQDLATNLTGDNFNKDTTSIGMNLQLGKNLSRAELPNINNLPPEMLLAMFSSEKDIPKGPFLGTVNAYMFVVRKISCDKSIEKSIKDARENITARIKEGLMEELLSYTKGHSNMKLKIDPKSLESKSTQAE